MGAVQKLATVVIVGLVALATVLVVYLADEPTRRGSETTEQDDLSLERGTSLYITYCLQCHGPHGFGATGGEDPPRVGAVLNQSALSLDLTTPTNIQFQSDDPVQKSKAEAWLRYSITYGKPSDPRLVKQMPAFGQELNVQQINDLVYLIMNGNWDYVYNQALLTTGKAYYQGICDATPTDKEACDAAEHGVPVYPTSPPVAGASEAPASPVAAEGGKVEIDALDPYAWSVNAVTVKPGDTITIVNKGSLPHDFSVDAWGINEMLDPGATTTVTVPADAKAGDYEFYCSVPGHKENGMVGTITVAS